MVHGGVSKVFFECRRRKDRGMLANMIDRLENAIYHWMQPRLDATATEQDGERAQTPVQQRVDLLQESDMPLDSRGGEKLLPDKKNCHERSNHAAAWASAAPLCRMRSPARSPRSPLSTVSSPCSSPRDRAENPSRLATSLAVARMRRRRTKPEATRRPCPEARLPCSSCAHSAVTELTRKLD